MTISEAIREQVRARAHFACEYCGVREIDCGGLLTIDHYRPRVNGGADAIENLLYCCFRCNLYKADYWPLNATDPLLWNPRQAAREAHLLPLIDGSLLATTPSGEFTLHRLRLNRPPLVEYRLRMRIQSEAEYLLLRYRQLLTLLKELNEQQATLLEEQRTLLEEQRTWLQLLGEGPG